MVAARIRVSFRRSAGYYSGTVSAPKRMRAWGAGVSAGYAVLGVIGTAVLHVPGSELLFGLCAVVTLALSLVVAPLLRPRRRGDDGDGGIGRAARARRAAAAVVAGVRARVPRVRRALDIRPRLALACR